MGKIQQISIDIAEEYNTTPEVIAYIRSCYKNLKLDHVAMRERQKEKIKMHRDYFSHLPIALEKRKKAAISDPKNKDRHLQKVAQIERQLKMQNDSIRFSILHFLDKINDSQFQKIVS